MGKKKVKFVICFIVAVLILIGGLVIYKNHKDNVAKNKSFQNENAKEYNKALILNDSNSEDVSITHDNINIGNCDKDGYKGQLLEKKGVSKYEFINTKYPGISEKLVNTSEARVVIRYYNPNVLTQKTLVKYYKNEIKSNKTPDITEYYLLDIYNKNYGIYMTNHSNKNNEFNVGNVNSHCNLVNNDNLIYCGIKKDGTITAYSANGDNSGKPRSFILKK